MLAEHIVSGWDLRVPDGFMTKFMRNRPPVALVGGYWERYPTFRTQASGIKPSEIMRASTA